MAMTTLLTGLCLLVLGGPTAWGATTELTEYLQFLRNTSQAMDEKILVDSYVFAYINYTYRNLDGELVAFSEEQGRYGEGKIVNAEGEMVHVTDEGDIHNHTSCGRIRGTKGRALPFDTPWIALVKRGDCTFEEKIRQVYSRGAVGIIVYNDRVSLNLEKMQIKDKERNIAAIFTYKWVGEDMANIVDAGFDVWGSITAGQSGSRPITTINRTSVLFVSISFIILMIIALVWLVFYYVQRFRYLQTKDQQSRHLCSATKRAIMKIPTKTGKSDEKDDQDCCAICIELYKPSDCIRVLPCKHEFHKNCIDPWLLEHRTCPMCKLDVLKFYGFVFLGSEECIIELDALSNAEEPPPLPMGAFSLEEHLRQSHIRRLVLEAMDVRNRGQLLERSQSSLSCVHNGHAEHGLSNGLQHQQGSVAKLFNSNCLPFNFLKGNNGELTVPAVRCAGHARSRSADSYYRMSGVADPLRRRTSRAVAEAGTSGLRKSRKNDAVQLVKPDIVISGVDDAADSSS